MSETARCTIDGCDRQHVARGLCELHYRRWRRTGSTADPEKPAGCGEEGCTRPHEARGLCRLHYRRLQRAELSPRCTVDDCTRPRYSADGLCQTHDRWQRRRAKHRTLSAEVDSWGLYRVVDIAELASAIPDWAHMKNTRRRRKR